MSPDRLRMPDPARSTLRAAVVAVDRAMPQTTAVDRDLPGSLAAAWRDLLALLALGPEPEYRECPTCGALAMLEATVCGHCWTKLPPLAPREVKK